MLAFFLVAAVQQPTVPSDTVRLVDVVVTANRAPTPASRAGASTTVLDRSELRRRGRTTVAEALQLVPGVAAVPAGGAGSIATVFLRGTASGHTLLLVDGVRQNDANLSAAPFLGGAGLEGVSRIEVVRGPQSTLYGGAAIGGVIAVAADPVSGPLRGELALDGGSFGSWKGAMNAVGSLGAVGVNAAATANGTDNQRPGNAWRQRTQFLRLDWAPAGGRITAGTSLRGLQQEFMSPGDLRDQNTTPVLATSFENHLATAWIDATLAPWWRSHLLLGYQQQFNASTGRWNGGPESRYTLRGDRWVADWQHRFDLGAALRLVAGVDREWSTVASDGTPYDERLFGTYADALLVPLPSLALGAGVRRDDYSTFGVATTGRLTASWQPDGVTRFHASAGSGFLPPGMLARYGSAFQAANSRIRPERSRGLDAGVERSLAGRRATVGIAWFRNTLRDLIGWESAEWPALGRNVNVDRARTWGVEISGRARFGAADLRLAWTGLTARAVGADGRAGDRLIRRPSSTFSGDLAIEIGRRGAAGIGLLVVSDRRDTDFSRFPAGPVNPGDYALVRLHGATEVARGLDLQLRVENALDARYEPVYGFPALGRSVTASLAYRWGTPLRP